MEKRLITDEFYSDGICTLRMLNRFTYKGRGRPRKTDYCTFSDVEKQLTQQMYNLFSVPIELFPKSPVNSSASEDKLKYYQLPKNYKELVERK